jgi:hypothetical protein
MKTLLKRDWSAQVLQQVPASFFTRVLLPALLSPLHYNTQLTGTLANSGAVLDKLKQQPSSSSDEFDVAQHAAHLLSSYVQCAGTAAAREVFAGGMQVVLTRRQDLSRAGLQALLLVLAAAAGQLQEGQLLQDLTQAQAGAHLLGSHGPHLTSAIDNQHGADWRSEKRQCFRLSS